MIAHRCDKAKCERIPPEHWGQVRAILERAIGSGCGDEFRGAFPSRVWIFVNNVLHEARLTNHETGEYHAFPLDDPLQYPVDPEDLIKDLPLATLPVS